MRYRIGDVLRLADRNSIPAALDLRFRVVSVDESGNFRLQTFLTPGHLAYDRPNDSDTFHRNAKLFDGVYELVEDL